MDTGNNSPRIADIVREVRLELGVTQEQFANILGVTFPTINRWENGHCVPSRLALKSLRETSSRLDKAKQEKFEQLLTRPLDSKVIVNL